MTAFWICREGNMVTAGVVARYANPEELARWCLLGRNPELVDIASGVLAVPAPLPSDAVVMSDQWRAP